MTTVGEAISRVRNTLKAVKEDAFLTDRVIYYSIVKYGQTLLKREDNQYRLMQISNIFSVLPYVELIDVDKIEAGCTGVYSDCYFKRTKEKIPDILSGLFGPIIRTVSSIDSSEVIFRTRSSRMLMLRRWRSRRLRLRSSTRFRGLMKKLEPISTILEIRAQIAPDLKT